MKHYVLVDKATNEIRGVCPAPYTGPRPPGAAPPIIPDGCEVLEVDDKPEGVPGTFDRKAKRIVIDRVKTDALHQAMLEDKITAAQAQLAELMGQLANVKKGP